MKRIILLFFLFSGCSYDQVEVDNNLSDADFSNDLTFEEFKIKTIQVEMSQLINDQN